MKSILTFFLNSFNRARSQILSLAKNKLSYNLQSIHYTPLISGQVMINNYTSIPSMPHAHSIYTTCNKHAYYSTSSNNKGTNTNWIAKIHIDQGNSLFNSGKKEEEIACYKKALELNRNYTNAQHNKEILLGKMHNNNIK